MNNRNYQKELEQLIAEMPNKSRVPRLLLHSCCAPCSSYVLEYLSEYFEITVFYYNPNIFPEEEYEKRVLEQQSLIARLPAKHKIHLEVGAYEPQRFYEMARGVEKEPEEGIRCLGCYQLRLEEAARFAKAGDYDYFVTSLTISPMKNATVLNEMGEQLGARYQIAYLPSDFKKKNGYKRSIELSQIYDLYRQNYCGCIYAQTEQMERKKCDDKVV